MRTPIILGLLVGGISLFTPEAHAQGFVDGNLYLNMCTEGKGLQNPSCMAYTAAVEDLLLAIGQKTFSICIPTNISGATGEEGVVKFFKEHPEGWASSAATLMLVYFASAYPCHS